MAKKKPAPSKPRVPRKTEEQQLALLVQRKARIETRMQIKKLQQSLRKPA